MVIEKIPVANVKPAAYNPRKDLRPGDPEYEKLRKSIETFDLVEPLVWNKRSGNLVGGHQRFKVLLERGETEVYVSVVDLDENAEKALNIALNKIEGGWDDIKLAEALEDLAKANYDVSLTGFDEEEIKKLGALAANAAGGAPSEEQGKLDEKNKTVCPSCGHEFST